MCFDPTGRAPDLWLPASTIVPVAITPKSQPPMLGRLSAPADLRIVEQQYYWQRMAGRWIVFPWSTLPVIT
ncbi:hypothetical protein CH295_16830 [Rhodococcus sp. 14-2483-1-2]|nr:hypothetical protein CH295_16830 [Rhodococcus sp. 14-2483-1-2]